MTEALLEAHDVSVAYGKIEAVQDVSLRVRRGQIATVIGPNGAGKSSLLNALMGAVRCSGRLTFDMSDITRTSIEDRVADGLCLVPEGRELFADMSVADNLMLGTYARYRKGERDFHADLEATYTLFPRLLERTSQQAGTLSGGERQMLAIGRALMARPSLLMLDEPSLGLAPRIVREIFRTVVSLRDRGVSLLIVEQNARAALQIADYGYVLEGGRVVLEGPAPELQRDRKVIETYLGAAAAHVRDNGYPPQSPSPPN